MQQLIKFRLVINLKAARDLALEVLMGLMLRDDELIERVWLHERLLLHLLTSTHGTNRKCQSASTMSALGCNPDGICSLRAFPLMTQRWGNRPAACG